MLPTGAPQRESDEQLLMRYNQGDQAAFTAINDRLGDEITNYLALRYFNGDRMLAEDATQVAFLKLAEAAPTIDLTRPIRPWLFFIASNEAVDSKRALARRPTMSFNNLVEDTNLHTFDFPDTKDINPLAAVTTNERNEELRQVMDLLPDDDRTALDAVYFKGLSFADAASQINIPIGSLKTRVHRALKFLRCRLAEADRTVQRLRAG